MTPNTVDNDQIHRLNEGMRVVLTLQGKLGCVKPAEPIQAQCSGSRLVVRFWVSQTYSLVVFWEWAHGQYDLTDVSQPNAGGLDSLLSGGLRELKPYDTTEG